MKNIITIGVPYQATYIKNGGHKENIITLIEDMEFEISDISDVKHEKVALLQIEKSKKQGYHTFDIFEIDGEYYTQQILKILDCYLYLNGGNIFQLNNFVEFNRKIQTIPRLTSSVYHKNLYDFLDIEYEKKNGPIFFHSPDNVKQWTGNNKDYMLNLIQNSLKKFFVYNNQILKKNNFSIKLNCKNLFNEWDAEINNFKKEHKNNEMLLEIPIFFPKTLKFISEVYNINLKAKIKKSSRMNFILGVNQDKIYDMNLEFVLKIFNTMIKKLPFMQNTIWHYSENQIEALLSIKKLLREHDVSYENLSFLLHEFKNLNKVFNDDENVKKINFCHHKMYNILQIAHNEIIQPETVVLKDKKLYLNKDDFKGDLKCP